MHRTENKLLCI